MLRNQKPINQSWFSYRTAGTVPVQVPVLYTYCTRTGTVPVQVPGTFGTVLPLGVGGCESSLFYLPSCVPNTVYDDYRVLFSIK